jgi:hypothetical protein
MIDAVGEQWSQARPLSAIGLELGVSRSVIAGLVSRARRRGDAQFAPRAKPERERPSAKPRAKACEAKAVADVVAEARPSEPVKPVGPVRETGFLLVDMNSRQCRYSVNNPARGEAHLFCGAVVAPGSAYCPKHRAALPHLAGERGQSDGRRRRI